MKRINVILISFLAGMLSGLAVPSHAAGHQALKSEEYVIDSVDTDACSITLDNGDQYAVDCDEAESFSPGEEVTMTTSQRGYQSLIGEDDQEADISN